MRYLLITLSFFIWSCDNFPTGGDEEIFSLDIYFHENENCADFFSPATGTVTQIEGDWATNEFSMSLTDTLSFQLPESGNYRVYVELSMDEATYWWDKTLFIENTFLFGLSCP